MDRDFLVLGHARSGTGYMSALFRALGFDVGHEKLGQHGVSAWQYAVYDKEYPYTKLPPRADIFFKYIIHVIRNPLDTINSVYNTDQKQKPAVSFRDKHLRIDLKVGGLDDSVASVLEWNRIIGLQKPDLLVKVEEAKDVLPQTLSEWGYAVRRPPYKWPSTDTNTRDKTNWKIFDWDGLFRSISGSLASELEKYKDKYGY